jgi:uncharacterized protein YndB with AHSA1/START domain
MNKILILCAMTLATQLGAQKAHTIRKTFSRTTAVSTVIHADPGIVWALLTNADDYKRWNSTIISVEGNIAKGEKIRLKSTLDPKRTFNLKVRQFEPEKTLVWGDAWENEPFPWVPASRVRLFLQCVKKSAVLCFLCLPK